MGTFAFETEPEHCEGYRAVREPPLPTILGLTDDWDMPIVRHRAVLPPGSRFPGVPHYILTYHISGAPVRRTDLDDGAVLARTGAVSLQIPGCGGTFESVGALTVDYAHLYFQTSLLEAVASESDLAIPTADFFGLVDINLQRDIVAYLDRAQDRRCPATQTEMDTRARIVLFGLLRAAATRDTDRPVAAAGLSGRLVQRVEDAILARLSDTIRLTELAEVAGMSSYHFARKFKSATGETPAAFVMRIRMEKAVQMLKETDLPVSEIAYRTGFSSQSHLSRRLRETYGESPGRLRNAPY